MGNIGGGMKKAGTRGAAGKKQPGGAAKESPQRARLLKSLRAAIENVDEEGLLFLLRQTQVLIRNAEVDRLNWEAEELEKKTKKKSPAARTPASSTHAAVEESGDGKAIFLVLGDTRKVMTVGEIKQLVRICWGAETKSDALRQLFTVFARERKDVLIDAGIGGPQSPLLESLFRAIRATYRLKDDT